MRDIALVFSISYFTFNLVWGLNYYRIPLAQSLNLQESYTTNELEFITKSLINKTNQLQNEINNDSTAIVVFPYTQEEFFEMTLDGYDLLEKKYPQFEYKNPSI